MAVKQVSIFIENETGRLTSLTETLAEGGIDMNAATIAETGEYGILRCIVQDPERAVEVLKKGGFMASVSDALAVAIDNKPGGLHYVLKMLSDADIAVKYIYSTIQDVKGEAVIVMKVSDQERAEQIRGEAGVKLCDTEELK